MLNQILNIIPADSFSILDRMISIVKEAVLSMTNGTFAKEKNRAVEAQFNEIVTLYDDLIVKLCFGYARTREELEDLHQDTLINVWQGLDKFEGKSSLRTWIYRVTLNTCVSTLRNRHKEINGNYDVQLYDVIDDSEERRIMIKELHEIISCLSPVDKAIVLMWLDEFSYEEIAEMMGMPVGSVGTRLRRAKEKLKNIR